MSKVPSKISHEGKIVAIDKEFVSVEILSKSACAECHAKGVCAASDQETRIIDIPQNISTMVAGYEVGDVVEVVLESSLGVEAVFIAYVVPLIVLVGGIMVFSAVGLSELLTGLLSLAAVAVYYVFVAIFRSRLNRVFTFAIERKITY